MAGPRSSPSNHASSSCRLIKGDLPSQQVPTTAAKQSRTPVRPGKRRHVATVSPVTSRSENRSPKAKIRPSTINRQSPPIIVSKTIASVTAVSLPSHSGPVYLEERSGSVTPSQLAVPRVSVPPCPSKLPMPPVHWMDEDTKCPTQRQQCRAVTESLLNHLTTSGILVAAA